MSIPTDDNTNTGLSDNDAVAQLMAGMTNAKGNAPSIDDEDEEDLDDEDQDEDGDEDAGDQVDDDEDANEDEDESDEDEDADEEEEEEEEEDDNQSPPAAAPVADDAVVKVLVNGEEQEFTVANLKRLAGQEASLTRKSQEADLVGNRAAAVLQGALESVLEDLEPYAEFDWVLEGRRMEDEEFEWHRQNYTRLTGRYQKLVGSAKEFDETVTTRKVNQRKEQAATALKVLADPEQGIPGWNDEVYQSIMDYGVSQGLDANDVAQIADASVMKLLYKAKRFDELQADKSKKREKVAEKINRAPKIVRKGSGRQAPSAADSKRQRNLEARVRSGRGSEDDAIAALVGRWSVRQS